MANTKKNARHSAAGQRPKSVTKANRGKKKHHHHHHNAATMRVAKRNNAGASRGGFSNVGGLVMNGIFVIAGALGSKLITQMVLGEKNTGVLGYGVNLLAGGALWFAVDKTMRNASASAGVISGTVVQIILRLINDYTPFGQYVSQLGMGDYQAQAFLTPQILADPYNSARIKFPAALMAAAAPPAQTMPAAVGVSGFDPLYGNQSLY